MNEPIRRIVVGARAKRAGALPPQVEPINLYALNHPAKGEGAVLLDAGFYVPQDYQRADMPFPINFPKVRQLAFEDLAEGLAAYGYDGVATVIATHGHIDHMGFAPELRDEYGCEFWTSGGERTLRLRPQRRGFDMRPVLQANGMGDGHLAQLRLLFERPGAQETEGSGDSWGNAEIPLEPARILRDEEVLDFGGERYRVCLVEGHSQAQVLLINETCPGDFALHGGDQIQRNEPPTFLAAAGENLGLGRYLSSLDRMFARHPKYRDIRRVYPAHASSGRLERFESTPVENLGRWWELCRGGIVSHLERALELIDKGAARVPDLFEDIYADELPEYRRKGVPGLFIEMFLFLRLVGRLDLLVTEGWDGARVAAVPRQYEGGERLYYERA